MYRNNELEEIFKDKTEEEQFYSIAIKYLGRKYEVFLNYLKEDEKKIYCSMLVSKIYNQLEVEVAMRKKQSHRILPIDIEKHLSRSFAWKEVTPIYRHLYDLYDGDVEFKAFKKQFRSAANQLAKSQFTFEVVTALMGKLNNMDDKLSDVIHKISNEISSHKGPNSKTH